MSLSVNKKAANMTLQAAPCRTETGSFSQSHVTLINPRHAIAATDPGSTDGGERVT